jgi:hypothetical protein
MSLKLNAPGGGSVTLQEPTTASNVTLNLPAANGTVVFENASGNVGIGVTPSAWGFGGNIEIGNGVVFAGAGPVVNYSANAFFDTAWKYKTTAAASYFRQANGAFNFFNAPSGTAGNAITFTQAMTLDASGNLLVGKTGLSDTGAGFALAGTGSAATGLVYFARDDGLIMSLNRLTSDGELIRFAQNGTAEGTISVSGTTVSYNGGHLSRWAQMLTKPDLLKGTVMSNLDEMNVYVDADGNPVENEQLNKVKVSDVEGDANVAGVFVNWEHDEAHNVDEINMAMTGDMIIRIAQGVTVQRGDLLMSAGDGTAKPQGDDIIRSKTIAKVTSIHVTCTYEDGSYCVPCVLMAC